ncbi:DUF6232 family protein [Pectobacterium sp. PL64]|uniref:DUF6232 family protein n=1 Tax=Pectobacterium sp. PL64 TaxID=2738983 RepID=UPI001F0B7DA9|nr:DUF6232 family protein [Pectobacterium sp. PL64]UMO86151.1 DUF6232 family protein [Pectobacterium sp. PL64]
MEEIEFYNDGNVSVTNSRFRVGSTTYAMNGVTSVKRGETDPSKVAPIVVALVGLAMVFLAATMTFKIIGGVVFLIAIAWFKSIHPDYIVFLNSASGESQALSSPDKKYINDVINALNEAIVHRG